MLATKSLKLKRLQRLQISEASVKRFSACLIDYVDQQYPARGHVQGKARQDMFSWIRGGFLRWKPELFEYWRHFWHELIVWAVPPLAAHVIVQRGLWILLAVGWLNV